ncbi:MAG: formyltransferase, partial [Fretibacterium sp.]
MSAPRRAVVFAYSSVGCVCLRTLLEAGVEVAAVYTHEDDPGEERWFDSVADLARARGLAVLTPALPDGAGEERIRALAPDLIFSFYYRSLIPERVLRLAPLGAFNMHGSLLPRYRGRACVNWAVLNGETETGVTLHHMTARADRGRIVDQASVPIGPDDTAHDVFLKLIPLAGTVLRRSLPAILAGRAEGVEQDESRATTFGRRRPSDGLMDWAGSARALHDLVRAVAPPFPGAFTFWEGRKLFVWRTRVPEGTDAACGAAPG